MRIHLKRELNTYKKSKVVLLCMQQFKKAVNVKLIENKDCGWQLIYDRLKSIGKFEILKEYREPKNYAKWSKPRKLKLDGKKATFKSLSELRTVSSSDGESLLGVK